jgi:serpin B
MKILSFRRFLLWLGFFCVIILALKIIPFHRETATPFTASPEVKSVVEGNIAFALDLYQKLKDQPRNLFFSPYSISTTLAMTYSGARGQTEKEMAKVLHFNPAQTNIHSAFGALTERMNKIQRWNRITLATANSLWCQQDYQFTDAFLNLIHKYYGADARQVDFKHSAQAASEINQWVGRKTKRKIKDAVEPGQFTDLTRLVLCNAIYFKGEWLNQFKTSDTKPTPFHVTTNETVTVPMMYQHSEFKMARSDDSSVELLELPYSGIDLSMIILLPQVEYPSPDVEQPGLPDLEQKLTADNLYAWLAKLDQAHPHKTSVMLPRFTTTQSLELTKELKSLGMVSAFDKNTANFSGMDGAINLFISEVIHKAFIEVNEAGTEAAATTWGGAQPMSQSGSFIVDHPFIFLIRENGSGTILFLGRIVDPTK